MKTETNIKYYSPILEEATAAITPQERAAFDLNYDISERIYQIIQKKGMTKRDLARLTGKKESEVSRWFMLGHNFTCKTIAMIQLALGEKIVEVVKSTFDRDYSFIVATKPKSDYFCTIKHTYG